MSTQRRAATTRTLLDPAFEERKERRSSMRGKKERRLLAFDRGNVDMRAQPNGTGGTAFKFEGYAATFDAPFQMWDWWGDEYVEVVNQGAFTRTLAATPDVPFLIGHNDGGIALARTRSGTMTLTQDTTGLHVMVPAMDGGSPLVQALASAVERGDMDEMSCAFITRQCVWSPDYEQRNMTELDLHRGDVSTVVLGANDDTAGASMVAVPVTEAVSQRRPVERRADGTEGEIMDLTDAPDYNPGPHNASDASLQCTNGACTVDGGAMNAQDARYCDQCGGPLYDSGGLMVLDDSGVVEEAEGDATLLSSGMPAETLRAQLDLLRLAV